MPLRPGPWLADIFPGRDGKLRDFAHGGPKEGRIEPEREDAEPRDDDPRENGPPDLLGPREPMVRLSPPPCPNRDFM